MDIITLPISFSSRLTYQKTNKNETLRQTKSLHTYLKSTLSAMEIEAFSNAIWTASVFLYEKI